MKKPFHPNYMGHAMTDEETEEIRQFKEGIRGYLELTDELVGVLRKAYEDLSEKYENLLGAIHALNTKVDIVATKQGILGKNVLQ
jgi:hypothetical protein